MNIIRPAIFCVIMSISFSAHAISLKVASSLTLVSAAISASTSYAAIQKCGVYISPEMTETMHVALAAGSTSANAAGTFWWLYKKTPQGRMRDAGKELDRISSVLSLDSIKKADMPVADFEAEVLKRAERANARDPFPVVKTARDLEEYDKRVMKVGVLLQKAHADIWPLDDVLLERHAQVSGRADEVGNIVKDMLVKIKSTPEYAKHLKYHNEKHAQDNQADAQHQQATAQKRMVWVGVANAAVNAVSATAQGAIAVAKLAKSTIDPFNPFKR